MCVSVFVRVRESVPGLMTACLYCCCELVLQMVFEIVHVCFCLPVQLVYLLHF